ncbi:hypothetical protein D3C75_870760 [compost metagenome]
MHQCNLHNGDFGLVMHIVAVIVRRRQTGIGNGSVHQLPAFPVNGAALHRTVQIRIAVVPEGGRISRGNKDVIGIPRAALLCARFDQGRIGQLEALSGVQPHRVLPIPLDDGSSRIGGRGMDGRQNLQLGLRQACRGIDQLVGLGQRSRRIGNKRIGVIVKFGRQHIINDRIIIRAGSLQIIAHLDGERDMIQRAVSHIGVKGLFDGKPGFGLVNLEAGAGCLAFALQHCSRINRIQQPVIQIDIVGDRGAVGNRR